MGGHDNNRVSPRRGDGCQAGKDGDTSEGCSERPPVPPEGAADRFRNKGKGHAPQSAKADQDRVSYPQAQAAGEELVDDEVAAVAGLSTTGAGLAAFALPLLRLSVA